jgi:basic amino acid/polyamine antiporter, APA family
MAVVSKEGSPAAPSADEQLERAIGPWALAANAMNLAVGAGIFVLPAVIAAVLGPAAIIAYLICGFAIALILICFVEVGTQVTRSGGAAAYIEEAFGPLVGFLGWVTFVVGFCVASDAAIANVLMDAAASAATPLARGVPRVCAMTLLFAALAAVNILGVRQGVRVAVATTVAKLAPLIFLIAAGLLAIRWQNLRWTEWPSAAKLGEASLVLFFAFSGAESALTPSAEIRDPMRTVPRGVLGGALALVLLYVALQVVSQGVLGDELPKQADAPLAAVAARLFGQGARGAIIACTAISVFGTLSADTIGTPRAFLIAAENGMVPARLAAVHPRFHTPHVAIATFAGLTLLAAVSGAFKPLAILSSASILLVYLAVCLAALRLRATRTRVPGSFRAPGGPVVPLLGAATVMWLLAHSTLAEAGAIVAMLVCAAAYYLVRRRGL